uniref:RING-type domain-containing protein n=1 Tax=Magallana gigas TaxID=29159 RepID=A0A8W8MJI9_MAGGI
MNMGFNTIVYTGTTHRREELEKRYDHLMCKTCIIHYVTSVFTPCGHFVCCSECAPNHIECPVCRKKIEKIIQANLK